MARNLLWGSTMITVRRACERARDHRRKLAIWLPFYPQARGAGRVELLDEGHLPPGGKVPPHARGDAELITYVREGALAFDDSAGRSGVIQTGEFQRMATGPGLRHRERNASRTEWAHVFQIRIGASAPATDRDSERKRFSAAERRGRLCLVASPDGRTRSLCTFENTLVYSAILDPGHHVVLELARGRRAWLQLIEGQVALGDLVLATGDGAEITTERAVSVTARAATELLLIDLDGQLTTTDRRPS